MSLFVDASAMVALIENEPERPGLLQRLHATPRRLWSAMSCWETVSALQNVYQRPINVARAKVEAFADAFRLEMVNIAAAELRMALDAYHMYGNGRHPARLNFGDCFAYACAKANDAELLYKGSDFSRTDMA